MNRGEKSLLAMLILFVTTEPSTAIGAVILLALQISTAILFIYWTPAEKPSSPVEEKER